MEMLSFFQNLNSHLCSNASKACKIKKRHITTVTYIVTHLSMGLCKWMMGYDIYRNREFNKQCSKLKKCQNDEKCVYFLKRINGCILCTSYIKFNSSQKVDKLVPF
jgi:hypothetical protein